MGSSNPKRRTCRHCGERMGFGEYVEIRILTHIQEPVTKESGGTYTRWSTKSLMAEYVCPVCAIGAVDRIKENRKVAHE